MAANEQDELREQVSQVLVKWHMPTRHIAIDEIMLTVAHHTKEAVERGALRAQLDAYFQLTGIAQVYSHEGLVSYINSQFDDLQAELAAPQQSKEGSA